jgi:hypothetical protein
MEIKLSRPNRTGIPWIFASEFWSITLGRGGQADIKLRFAWGQISDDARALPNLNVFAVETLLCFLYGTSVQGFSTVQRVVLRLTRPSREAVPSPKKRAT